MGPTEFFVSWPPASKNIFLQFGASLFVRESAIPCRDLHFPKLRFWNGVIVLSFCHVEAFWSSKLSFEIHLKCLEISNLTCDMRFPSKIDDCMQKLELQTKYGFTYFLALIYLFELGGRGDCKFEFWICKLDNRQIKPPIEMKFIKWMLKNIWDLKLSVSKLISFLFLRKTFLNDVKDQYLIGICLKIFCGMNLQEICTESKVQLFIKRLVVISFMVAGNR